MASMQNVRYTSEELFHFVGHKHPNDHDSNYETLKKILSEKCISHPPHTPGWGTAGYTYNPSGNLLKEGMLVPEVVCFSDIPCESLSIHLGKYGLFGVSLKRDHLIRYGTRPVMYVPYRNDDWGSIYGVTLFRDIEEIYRSFREHLKEKYGNLHEPRLMGTLITTFESSLTAIDYMIGKDFLAFIKPFNSQLGETDLDNFYMEREWRRLGNVCFDKEHIGRIIVRKGYSERLRNEFPKYADMVEEKEI